MPASLDDLFAASPYLRELHARDGAWLARALGEPDHELENVLLDVDGAGKLASDEETVGRELRTAKGRVALLAAAAETSGRWTTAQSTAALSDLADAALEIGADPAAIASGLETLFAMSEARRAQMGGNGRRLVARRFTWPKAAAGMEEIYRRVTSSGAPECMEQAL